MAEKILNVFSDLRIRARAQAMVKVRARPNVHALKFPTSVIQVN